MADAKFKAALPKDEEANGLAGSEWNRRLLEHIDDEYVALVTFTPVDAKGLPGFQTAVAGFTRFEPVTDEAEAEILREQIAAVSAKRLGKQQLPINETPEPPKGRSAKVTQLPITDPLEVTAPEGGEPA